MAFSGLALPDGLQRRAQVSRCGQTGSVTRMLLDIVVAIIIVAIAAVLGLVVHPILWVIVIAAVLWLFTRRGSWARHY
jgi:hypothetical protein